MSSRPTPTTNPVVTRWLPAPDGPALSSDLVLRLARERDHLFLLHETTAAAERAGSIQEKLEIFLTAVLRVGFRRGSITVRDVELEPTLLVTAGLTPDEEEELRADPTPGAAWRRRLGQLGPYRISESYYLDSRDPWIAHEFGNAVPSSLEPRVGGDWSPRDALLVPLRGSDGSIVGTLILDDPPDRARPTMEQIRTVELYASHMAILIERVRLQEERDREQRLSGALADVARAVNESLEPAEVHQLIVRHAIAVLKCEAAGLTLLDGDHGCVVAVAGTASAALRDSRFPIAGTMTEEAIRTGRPLISNDYPNSDTTAPSLLAMMRAERVLVVPLISRTGPIGALSALDRSRPFSESDGEFLQRLADQVAMAVVNASLFLEVATLAERYRSVVSTTRDAIVITDRSRRIVFGNPAADELFGTQVGARVLVDTFVPPHHREAVRDREDRAFAGEPQRYESVVQRPDGELRLVAVASAPLREGDEITGVVATLRDVTDERRARDAVAQSEARYRNIFETATDAIYTLDARGAFTSVNDATCTLTGVRREGLLGQAVARFLDPADAPRVKEHVRVALGGTPRRYECHVLRDGERRLVSVTNTPIRHGTDFVGILGIARDVTDDRAREQALARSQARYTRLVESASDAIFTTDPEGRLTSVNRALEVGIGQRRDSLLGRPFVDLVDARDADAVAALLADSATGNRNRGALRYRSVDGETRHGSLLAAPIYEGGDLTGILGIVRDVTDERRLSEQLLQQEKLAAVGQLVSGVAHELNNPLAGVVAFSQLLLAAEAPPEQRRAVETIHGEAKRAARIVANLLTFARQHQPERALTDLNRIIESTLELRRYAMRTREIEVDLQLDAMLPLTWADPHQLQQVLVNLVANAEHALAEWPGTRRITLHTAHRDDTLTVRIADTGPGIAPEHVSRVFNPFFTTKGVGEGTGLGLSISHGIVREHGGRIRVDSRPGEGATFTIEIPFVAPPAPAAPAGPDTGTPSAAATRRVLVVDDEPAIRAAVTSFLASLGHIVDSVGSGREAVARIAASRYDAVLLDLRMPDMSGDAVFTHLRANAPETADRVVFVTGDIQSESARRFLEATGRPVLMKPFLLDDLAALLADPVETA